MTAPSRSAGAGLTVWFAVAGGIVAWIVHLTFAASAVELLCEHSSYRWTLHAATAITAAVTVVAMALALQIYRHAPDPESSGSAGGQLRFLGLMGLLVGAINLALILLEGSFVLFIHPCA